MVIIKTASFLRAVVLLVALFSLGWISLYFTFPQKAEREKKIELALQKAQSFLVSAQRENGAICDTVNSLFDTWETILASAALYEMRPDSSVLVLKKALQYLRQNENAEGLVCHNLKCRESYCLETTAEYFSLLMCIGEKEKVKQRLPAIRSRQKASGEWDIGNPDVREEKHFPSVTAFVLGILNDAGMEPMNKKQAYNWLLKSQKADGHWGYAWEYYGCPAYALWPAMRALRECSSPETDTAKYRAIRYIYSQQKKDGSWCFVNPTWEKQTSPELQTALMLTTLKYAGFANRAVVEKGIDFLLSIQAVNGSWDGGDFPIPNKRYVKKEYVMATSLSMRVLKDYLQTYQK